MRWLTFILPLALFAIAIATAHARVTPPAWLSALATQPATMEYGDAAHVVLLDEESLSVDSTGIVTHRIRYVVRILTHDGTSAATARIGYETSGTKVTSFHAWLIPKIGDPRAYGKKDTLDRARFGNALELYGESRESLISAKGDASPGAVFGYEVVTVENSIFVQHLWCFQQEVPVELSRLTLTLPEGWSVESRVFNHEPIAATAQGKSQTWALQQLPAVTQEPLGPPSLAQRPLLALDVIPPPGALSTLRRRFASWPELSAFFSTRYDAPSTPDAPIKKRADELVQGAGSSWERITRLCRSAQAVNYISIALDLAHAGGMTPRPAPLVFKCNYGDCKDKSTLLRALLRTQGIESFPVVVYSGDATHVRPEWVSPFQFNHCILAIRVDDTVDVPALFIHPSLGRFVIFDPTNQYTPPGWLAEESAGGHGLILAGAQGELIRLPALRQTENRFERKVSAQLAGNGSITGTIEETFIGNASTDARDGYRSDSASEYRKRIDLWLGQSLPAATTSRLTATDDFDRARFSHSMDFTAPNYGKLMRDTLLVFKPVLVARRSATALKKGPRTQPVLIEASSFSEKSTVALPADHRVDEAFEPVEIKAPFGEYRARAEIRDNVLHFQRSLELRETTLPAADYEIARAFFEKVLRADQSPVVLKKI